MTFPLSTSFKTMNCLVSIEFNQMDNYVVAATDLLIINIVVTFRCSKEAVYSCWLQWHPSQVLCIPGGLLLIWSLVYVIYVQRCFHLFVVCFYLYMSINVLPIPGCFYVKY